MNGTSTPCRRTITDQVLQNLMENSAIAKLKVLSTFPTSNRPRDLWIDVRVTHALQRGKLRQTYKFCREVFETETAASDDRDLPSYLHKTTHAVSPMLNTSKLVSSLTTMFRGDLLL